MIRYTLPLLLFLSCFNTAVAQRDTSLFLLKYVNSFIGDKFVAKRDSADFFRLVISPDTAVDKNLFVVKEFYMNGKIKLISKSKNDDFKLVLQGYCISFFPNGHKETVKQFENGILTGDVITYYPNGNLYYIKTYAHSKDAYLKQCNDSTGKVLAENGTGKWIEFNEKFNKEESSGPVVDGVPNGEWRGIFNASTTYMHFYDHGKIKYSALSDNQNDMIYSAVDSLPQFHGGLDALAQFLVKNMHYPITAKEHNTQGRIIVTFTIEKDGAVNDVRIARGIGDGCDEEAVRVIKLLPKWKPGLVDGNPVRVAYSMPFAFNLESR